MTDCCFIVFVCVAASVKFMLRVFLMVACCFRVFVCVVVAVVKVADVVVKVAKVML